MSAKNLLRYLAPNLVTAMGLVFGLLSMAETLQGDYASAGWWIVYATLTDRLDGFVARLVRGTSELGGQLDSFADFMNFGLAPAFLIYVALSSSPVLPFTGGSGQLLLMLGCAGWVFAATFRLARFNITEDVESPLPAKIFFGVPTTLAAGVLVLWFLALYKYSPAGAVFPGLPEPFGGPKLIDYLAPGFEIPAAVWRYVPVVMLAGAYLMASSLRMLHLGPRATLPGTIIMYILIASGIIGGFGRIVPEYLVLPPLIWLVVYLIWGKLSPVAQRIVPPPIFPRQPR